ncbi:MAG: dTMP kinase [Bacteriovoracaceae bacterium]|nr:dTMP kinase [Bacteriovoracaceae bacterium]
MKKSLELGSLSAPKTKNSYFISFEGIEGSGKSTQIKLFETHLKSLGFQVLVLREPGGTEFGEKLRQVMLDGKNEISALAQTYLFLASRAQLLNEVVMPWLQKPKHVVILDRYVDSTLAYQGYAGGLGAQTILKLHDVTPLNNLPHLTFYLAISLEASMARQLKRGREKDYFESKPKDFYQKLIAGYDDVCETFPERVKRINGEKSQAEVTASINQIWENFCG